MSVPADPIAWLFDLEQFGIKLGLETITTLLGELGHPEATFASVHIAGTNGKGSVTAMVDAALRAAGRKSARYTSPHLQDLTERFVTGGRPVEGDRLATAVGDLRATVERLRRQGRLAVQPTFFEAATAVAFELFRRAGAEIAVCEVGLGGRLDATNVLKPVASAITSIGFDHQQHLGRTLHAIASEKAGIVKPGVPVVVGRMDAAALAEIAAVARRQQAVVVSAWEGTDVVPVTADATAPQRLRVRTPDRDYGVLALALAGAHQIDNAVVAIRLLEVLDALGMPVPPGAVAEGLAHVRWPGRLDLRRLADGREVLLDAAHNPDGAAVLAAFLRAHEPGAPLVFGAMRDKDVAAMIGALAPAVGAFVMTRASSSRSADPADLANVAAAIRPERPVAVEPGLRDALASAWRLAPRIVVAGSIFLLGDVMNEIAGS